jgi:outer membrane protein TolC
MKRQSRAFLSWMLIVSTVATGCAPQQPFYCREDGDLSHYLDVATQIEYPDVEEPSLCEVQNTLAPLTLKNTENYEIWDLPLSEVIHITLCNSQVMRQAFVQRVGAAPDTISRTLITPGVIQTSYDPALVETVTGLSVGSPFQGSGPEAALSEFDAQLDASVFWERNHRPQNRNFIGAPSVFQQDLGTGTLGITKTTAVGTQFAIRNNTNYDSNNTDPAFRPIISEWNTNLEASFAHPLLQGSGAQYNRIAGPFRFDQYASGIGNPIDGVMISRIRTDQTLADFEGGVRNLMRDAEQAYWELYFTYRDLEARKMGRDSALETWKKTHALFLTGTRGGSADREAQARSQYFLFRGQVEQALTEVFRAENRLRYIMGLSMSDGRLIRPSDEPTTARVAFEWSGIHIEALTRRVEVRKQKWEIKRRELELIAARNLMLPRIDAVGRYRWLGLGDELINQSDAQFIQPGSSAWGVLTSGQFQEWQLGLQASIPIGFRRELSSVRHHELLLARDRALLQDLELEISHQLGNSIRDIDLGYGLTQTNFNRRIAAEAEVVAVAAQYEFQQITLDLLLDAQRRRAESESAYYRSLVDYNQSIMNVHYHKGSLLDYDGVYLAEGPWPGKAYFDAMRQARKRDAGLYMDYGYTRPNVVSRGPIDQGCAEGCEDGEGGQSQEMFQSPGPMPDQALPTEETLPAPQQVPSRMTAPPAGTTGAVYRREDAMPQSILCVSKLDVYQRGTESVVPCCARVFRPRTPSRPKVSSLLSAVSVS